ncbi:MAG: co-chaperone GroES [Patescibacteria group bacterium]|nr:co-chaperone GroES [Patescibacteria group bacterium]
MKKKIKKSKPKSKAKKSIAKSAGNKSGVMPLGDRVLVKPLSQEEMGKATSFGIIIPETVDKEKSEQGIVVAVGPGKKTDAGHVVPVSVKVGDKVIFNKYGYDEVKVSGVEYFIVAESNVLAILN